MLDHPDESSVDQGFPDDATAAAATASLASVLLPVNAVAVPGRLEDSQSSQLGGIVATADAAGVVSIFNLGALADADEPESLTLEPEASISVNLGPVVDAFGKPFPLNLPAGAPCFSQLAFHPSDATALAAAASDACVYLFDVPKALFPVAEDLVALAERVEKVVAHDD
jgi:hypothetical protein